MRKRSRSRNALYYHSPVGRGLRGCRVRNQNSALPHPHSHAQSIALAVFAAMAATVFRGEAFLLLLRAKFLRNPAVLFDNDVAAFGHAERLAQPPEMIE